MFNNTLNRELRKLKKKLDKLYHQNGQHLYVTVECYFNRKNDWCADVYATTKDGNPWNDKSVYMFEVRTLDCFKDWRPRHYNTLDTHFTKIDYFKDLVETFDSVGASCAPLYIARPYRLFTLKKFGCLTEEDLYKCTRYFTRKVLDWWMCWNITVILQYEGEDIENDLAHDM